MSFIRDMLGIPSPRSRASKGLYVGGRKYNSADVGRMFADFNGSNGSADQELYADLYKLRNRARDLERNEPLVRGFFDSMRKNVIGPKGMRLQVKARNNRDSKLDTRGNEMVEAAWEEFSMKGNCTPCGQYSMRSLSNLALSCALRDGEAFFQVVFGKDVGPHGIAFHAFEPDLIDEKKNARLRNGNRIKMGVELNRYGRPVAYWKKTNHPGDQTFSTISGSDENRIPAENIIHVKLMRRFGQTRGEPTLAPVISTFKMVNGHREAELVASRIAASKMGFFTSQSGESFPVDGDEEEAGIPVTDVSPGTFWQLPADMDFKPFDPSHPSTAFGDFQRNVLMSTSAGLGISYETLTGDVGNVSYSSLRQVAISERDFYVEVQEWFKEEFTYEVYRRWISHAFDFGVINMPIERVTKFLRASIFRCRGFKWVDPHKEVLAVKEAMHLGIMSMTEASDQLGYDLEETFNQISREKEMAESMGLTLAFEPFGASPGSGNAPPPEENEGQSQSDEDGA